MSLGLSNREIANRLFIAHGTVRWYIRQIYNKLGAENREQAIKLAVKMKLDLPDIKHNLPAQINQFIGREQEVTDLSNLLNNSETRLLTILAPGGMGKTRLALEVARQQLQNYPDGVFYIALTPLNSTVHLISSIADALELQFQADRDPKEQLLDFLRVQHCLLILDNFEHLLDATSLVHDILKTTTNITLLITSREKLALSSEKVYSIGGMMFPDLEQIDNLIEYDAIRLFMQSATSADVTFQPQTEDWKSLTRICQLTEGMPLAIMLAGAWVDVLSLSEIVEEIQHNIDFLAVELRDIPRRQWSIRAVFEPTWNRLSDDEKNIIMKFALFRNGCTREAAQAVTGASLRHLQTFVNKALLTRTPSGRYDIQELLRQYMEDQLTLSGQVEETQIKHCRYFMDFLIRSEPNLKGQKQTETIREIEADFENIRSAWNHSIDRRFYDTLAQASESLFWYCAFIGHFLTGINLLQLATTDLDRYSDDDSILPIWGRLQARLIYLRSAFVGSYSQLDATRELLLQGLRHAKDSENTYEIAWYHRLLGDLHCKFQNYDTAMMYFEESLRSFRKLEDQFYSALTLGGMAHVIWMMGDVDTAIEYEQEQLVIQQEVGDRINGILTLACLSNHLSGIGDLTTTEQYLNQAAVQSKGTHRYPFVEAQQSIIAFLNGDFEAIKLTSIDALEKTTHMQKSLMLVVLSLLECIDGNYDRARQLSEEALQIAPKHKFFPNWSLAFVAALLEDYPKATQASHIALDHAISTRAIGKVLWCIPVIAMIEAHSGKNDRAVELLSLAFNHPASATGWLKKWEIITQFRTDLETELGTDVYDLAWKRGKHLDLEEVVYNLS